MASGEGLDVLPEFAVERDGDGAIGTFIGLCHGVISRRWLERGGLLDSPGWWGTLTLLEAEHVPLFRPIEVLRRGEQVVESEARRQTPRERAFQDVGAQVGQRQEPSNAVVVQAFGPGELGDGLSRR